MGRIQSGTFLAIVWLFCLVIDNGSAIKCWDCRSNVNPKCGDPFDNRTFDHPVDCIARQDTAQTNRCKIIKHDNGTIFRSCATQSEIDMPTNCTRVKNDKGLSYDKCYCDTDGCNTFAAHTNSGFSTVPIFGVVTSLFFALMTYTIQ